MVERRVPGIVLLFADQTETERVVELYALAATQGIIANSRWFEDIAGDEIATVAEELPADWKEAIQKVFSLTADGTFTDYVGISK